MYKWKPAQEIIDRDRQYLKETGKLKYSQGLLCLKSTNIITGIQKEQIKKTVMGHLRFFGKDPNRPYWADGNGCMVENTAFVVTDVLEYDLP